MPKIMTREELRAENEAAEAAEAETKTELVDDYVEEVESDNDEVEVETEVSEDAETEEAEAEPELEAWQVAEESEEDSGFVPDSNSRRLRLKAKEKLEKKNSEIEELRAEVEALKSTKQEPSKLAKPRKEDFDFDDDKYEEALLEYQEQVILERVASKQNEEKKQSSTQQVRQQIDKGVDGHYERVSQLVGDGKITEDAYTKADGSFRQLIESAVGKDGDAIADLLIANLGEGSEKVIYKVGIDTTEQARILKAFRDDSTGIQASIMLGALKAKLSGAVNNRVSSAPKPASKVQGDGNPVSDSKLKRRYSSESDPQKQRELYKKAKAAGLNPQNW